MSSISEIMHILLYTITWAAGIFITLMLISQLYTRMDFLNEEIEEKSSIVLAESGGRQDEIIYISGEDVYATIISSASDVPYAIFVNGIQITPDMLKDYESNVSDSLQELKNIINLHGKYKRVLKFDKDCNLKNVQYSY